MVSRLVGSRDVSLRVLDGNGSLPEIDPFRSISIIVLGGDVFGIVGFVPDKPSEILDKNALLILVTANGSMAPT